MSHETNSLAPEQLTEQQHTVLVDWLTQLADDEFILGHRDSEWLGLCPTVEEDVAFSSIAQDEVGHAVFYYELIQELEGVSADYLAFQRPAHERKNSLLVERENGDWAYTIVRHYLYDLWDQIRLDAMVESRYTPLAHGTQKMKREEYYHLIHFQHWFARLTGCGGEAQERMKQAMEWVEQDLDDLLDIGVYESDLLSWGILTKPPTEMRSEFYSQYEDLWKDISDLSERMIIFSKQASKGRMGQHSPALASVLENMTEVIRFDPNAQW
ncbi:1,2-phenylacetyl-CoA epoxidase subunit PaaC [Thermoactinomyces sp. DSM 45892]|uniref:1,2-phenylacetyl-CoA epoxidase subunit PaaC n=1 Tax=Thermoactinomyces sp. DSM 45892 TaxID=1882753 RepID=UPI000897CEC8|nr:1,2-phenylacetyl-CoA epoxidase subunit PaaC [Thermoactinomyces sp. DSM 45892]SDZ33270.1 ring-1,2-phenylacetyl-CoA epoxidase subunit PaaC [Thermoactinomyces sp. DSM 45892]